MVAHFLLISKLINYLTVAASLHLLHEHINLGSLSQLSPIL